MKYAVRKFPRGLVTGTCSLSWTLPSEPQTPSKIKRSQSMNTNHPEAPVGQSLASTTRPSPGPMVRFDAREEFTNQDIESLNDQLEKNVLSTDSGNRLSRSQTTKQSSRSSNISERSNASNVSDKPWKP